MSTGVECLCHDQIVARISCCESEAARIFSRLDDLFPVLLMTRDGSGFLQDVEHPFGFEKLGRDEHQDVARRFRGGDGEWGVSPFYFKTPHAFQFATLNAMATQPTAPLAVR